MTTKVLKVAVDPNSPNPQDADTSVVGWPTPVPELWATWVNYGWDLTHQATGYKVPPPMYTRICCRDHAIEFAAALAHLDWNIPADGFKGDGGEPYREAVLGYGDVWRCDDWEPRLTLNEIVEIVTHRLGAQGNEPDVHAVIEEAIRAKVVAVVDTGGLEVDW